MMIFYIMVSDFSTISDSNCKSWVDKLMVEEPDCDSIAVAVASIEEAVLYFSELSKSMDSRLVQISNI